MNDFESKISAGNIYLLKESNELLLSFFVKNDNNKYALLIENFEKLNDDYDIIKSLFNKIEYKFDIDENLLGRKSTLNFLKNGNEIELLISDGIFSVVFKDALSKGEDITLKYKDYMIFNSLQNSFVNFDFKIIV